jgi:Flp pilus assembly protein TadG
MRACGRHLPGQALVEAALVMPMFVLITLSVVQVVLYAHARDVLATAALQGARLAAEEGRAPDEGYARAESLARAGLGTSIEPLRIHVQVGPERVDVQVDSALRPVVPLPFAADLPLHAESSVTRERFRPGGARLSGP